MGHQGMTDSEFLGMVLLFLVVAFVLGVLLIEIDNSRRKP